MNSDQPLHKHNKSGILRRLARWLLRPFRTVYPDQGRRIVQGPLIREMIDVARTADRSIKHILNAGAGEGLYTPDLLRIAEAEEILEFDLPYPKQRKRGHDSRQWLVYGSVTSIPVENEWADFVLCTEVLEHVQDDRQAVAELARATVFGGFLLITVPTPPAPYDPAHVREGYTLEELSALLEEAGFSPVISRFCMYGAFKLLLRWWRRLPWIPPAALWMLTGIDRWLTPGKPMDLMILCRRDAVDHGSNPKTS